MTLQQMLSNLYTRLHYEGAPDARVSLRLTAFLNETQRELVSDPDFRDLLRHTQTFASVASRDYYSLPPSVHRIISLRDTTNNITLQEMTESKYREIQSDPSENTGTSYYYVRLGMATVARRPTDASEIFIKSDSASDTQTVYWEVLLSSGALRTGSTTLTGTTAVSLDTSITTVVEVLDLYLSSAAIGTITGHEDSGAGTQFTTINIGRTRGQFWRIALWPTPSSAITYTVDAETDVTDLAFGQDEPVLPRRWHSLLLAGARMKEYEYKDDARRYAIAASEYQQGRGSLKSYLAGGSSIIPGGPKAGWSPLGANYPAERYF